VYAGCNGANCLAVYVNGSGQYTGTWSKSSDERMKRDIEPLRGSMDQLLRLQGVSFYWKDPSEHGNDLNIQRGFIAQQYEKVFPEWVHTDQKGFKAIDTTGLDALEVESIRQLKLENDLLKERVAALESGRQPRVAGFNLMNGLGFGVGGLAIAGAAVIISRRKREERPAKL
jgi:hypothetical protein